MHAPKFLMLTSTCFCLVLCSARIASAATGCESLGSAGSFVDYSQVQSIFTSTAFCYGCHDGSGVTLPSSLDLHDSTSYAQLVNVLSTQVGGGVKRVLPGNAASSYLFEKLNCSGPTSGAQMPQGGPFLSAANKLLIRDWINQGAYNVATKYLVTSNSSSPAAGSGVTISAQLADSNGNALQISGKTVNWSKTGSGGSLSVTSSNTNSSGIATVTLTTSTTAGTTYTVTGTDGGGLTGTTTNITSVAGAATKYLVTSSGSSPVAGAAVTITAQLADANNNSVSTAGRVVTWSKTGSGGSFGSTTSTTNSSGIATVTFTTSTTAGTVYAVTGTDTSAFTGTTSSITSVPGASTKYLVTSNSSSPIAGLAVTITAQLTDANNNSVSTNGLVVTWSKTGGGSFASPTSTTNSSGIATVSFTTNTTSGTVHTVTGTDTGARTGTSSNITTIAGAAAKYLVSRSSSSPVSGAAVTVTAQLADSNNNSVSTASLVVTWSSTNGGSFASPTSTTNASGVATISFTTGTVAGTVHTATGTDGSAITGTSGNITTTAGAAAKYVVTSSSSSPVSGAAVTITAQLADANNNSVSTASLVVTWSKTGSGGTFGSPTSTTNGSGIATISFTTGTTAGTVHTVTGTDTSTFTGTTSSITSVAGTATKYIVTSNSYSPAAELAVSITAQLADANNNSVGTSGRVVTWSHTGSGGSFANPTSTTNSSGIASISFTTSVTAGTIYTITGTDTGALTGTSPNITSIAGTGTRYLVSASNFSPVAGAAVTITAQLADNGNNPVTTASLVVTWSSTNGGSFASPTSTTDAGGVATISFTTNTTAGTVHVVTGTDGNAVTGSSANVTTTVGAAAKYVVTSGSSGPVAGAAVTITAQLSDANNNAVNGAGNVVTWSKTGTGGTFATPTSITDANGVATVSFTSSATSGIVYTVTGTDAGTFTGTSGNITTVVGAAAKYIVTSNSFSPLAGLSVTLSAQLSDVNNNLVNTAGLVVTWSKTGAGGSFASTTSTTNGSGVATVSFTTSTTVTTYAITGTDTGALMGTSANITSVAGTGAMYLVSSSSNFPVAGAVVTITAQLADGNSNPVSTAGLVVAWTSTNGGTFASPTSTTDGGGTATVSFTTAAVDGIVYTVTGTDGNAAAGTSGNISTVVGAAAKYVVTASSGGVVAGSSVSITAQLTDSNNNVVNVAGNVVTWSSANGGGFSSPSSATNSSGVATVTFTSSTTAGTVHTVTGTDAGTLTGTTGSITTVAGAAVKYLVSLGGNNPVAGTAVTVTAQLSDVNNNPVVTSGLVVTWTGTNGGVFASSTSSTNSGGVASVAWTVNAMAGTVQTATATDTNLLSGTSGTLTTVVGVVAKYVVATGSSNPVAGTAVSVAAQLADTNGNAIGTAGRVVTWFSNGNGIFSSASSITNASGIASVIYTTSTMLQTVAFAGTDTQAITGTSASITTVAGVRAEYVVTASSFNPAAGTTVAIAAQLGDINGNPLSSAGEVVSWSSTGGGTFSSPTSVTNAGGVASVVFTPVTVTGTIHTITGTDGAGFAGTSVNIVTRVGTAAGYRVTASNNSPVAGSLLTISAQLVDSFNNSVLTAGRNVFWSKSGTGGALSVVSNATNGAGVATVTFATATMAGITHTVTGTDNSGFTGTCPNILTMPGAGVKYIVTCNSFTPVAGAGITVTAQFADVNGNTVGIAGKVVSWTSSNGGIFGSAQSSTNSSGLASMTFTTGVNSGALAITATDTDFNSGTSAIINTVAGSAAAYLVSVSNSSPSPGASVRIQAQLVDINANAIGSQGRVVAWSKTGVGGFFSIATSQTDSSGMATVVFTTSKTPGEYSVTATETAKVMGTSGIITTPSDLGAPIITSLLLAHGSVGSPFSYTITANGTAPLTFSTEFLPEGLVLNGSEISGIPTAQGSFSVDLAASNSAGDDSETLVISIDSSGTISSEDTDGDGVPDVLENLAGTDPDSPDEAPECNGVLFVERTQVSLNFAAGSRDNLIVIMSLALPDKFVPQGSVVSVRFGSRQATNLVLNEFGVGSSGKAAVLVKPPGRGFALAAVRFSVKNDDLVAELEEDGFVNETTLPVGERFSVPVAVAIVSGANTCVYSGSVNVLYQAKEGRTGKAKKAL